MDWTLISNHALIKNKTNKYIITEITETAKKPIFTNNENH